MKLEMSYYILIEKVPLLTNFSMEKWLEWIIEHDSETIISYDKVSSVEVLTIFIGSTCLPQKDHLLFDTSVIGGEYDGYERQYETWKQAEIGHKEILSLLSEE